MLENKKFEGEYYSRFIASWVKAGGYEKYGFEEPFEEWLKSFKFYDCPIKYTWTENGWKATNLDGVEYKTMPDDVVREIVEMATMGKMEFEGHTKKWIADNRDRLKEYGYN